MRRGRERQRRGDSAPRTLRRRHRLTARTPARSGGTVRIGWFLGPDGIHCVAVKHPVLRHRSPAMRLVRRTSIRSPPRRPPSSSPRRRPPRRPRQAGAQGPRSPRPRPSPSSRRSSSPPSCCPGSGATVEIPALPLPGGQIADRHRRHARDADDRQHQRPAHASLPDRRRHRRQVREGGLQARRGRRAQRPGVRRRTDAAAQPGLGRQPRHLEALDRQAALQRPLVGEGARQAAARVRHAHRGRLRPAARDDRLRRHARSPTSCRARSGRAASSRWRCARRRRR